MAKVTSLYGRPYGIRESGTLAGGEVAASAALQVAVNCKVTFHHSVRPNRQKSAEPYFSKSPMLKVPNRTFMEMVKISGATFRPQVAEIIL